MFVHKSLLLVAIILLGGAVGMHAVADGRADAAIAVDPVVPVIAVHPQRALLADMAVSTEDDKIIERHDDGRARPHSHGRHGFIGRVMAWFHRHHHEGEQEGPGRRPRHPLEEPPKLRRQGHSNEEEPRLEDRMRRSEDEQGEGPRRHGHGPEGHRPHGFFGRIMAWFHRHHDGQDEPRPEDRMRRPEDGPRHGRDGQHPHGFVGRFHHRREEEESRHEGKPLEEPRARRPEIHDLPLILRRPHDGQLGQHQQQKEEGPANFVRRFEEPPRPRHHNRRDAAVGTDDAAQPQRPRKEAMPNGFFARQRNGERPHSGGRFAARSAEGFAAQRRPIEMPPQRAVAQRRN